MAAYTALPFFCLARRKFPLLPAVLDLYHELVKKMIDIANNVPRFHILFTEPLLCQNPSW